jgi:hypothetical protein
MDLAVLKNQDWILYSLWESWILRTCGSKPLEDLWRIVVLTISIKNPHNFATTVAT